MANNSQVENFQQWYKGEEEECVPRVASPKARVPRKRKKAIDDMNEDEEEEEEEVESDSQEEEELEVVQPATGKCKGICCFSSCAALE